MIQKQITIDLWKPTNQIISIVQHESEGRTLYFQLTSGGLPVNVSGADVVFYAKKPDGNIVFNNCVIEDGANGQVSYLITGQTCVLSGDLDCFIMITNTSPTVTRTQNFKITVKPSEDVSGAVESTSEFTDLETALATIAGLIPNYSLEQDINGLHLVGDEDAPAAASAYGYDGAAKGFLPFQKSVNFDNGGIELDGDEETPDNGYFYGVKGGEKGFYVPIGINKNYIINGNFDIWQRGTSQTSSGYGSDDRWKNANFGSTKTHSQQAFAAGQTDVPYNPTYYSRTVVSSVAGASNYCSKHQNIEDVSLLSGETLTLSFWAKADANKNMAVEFQQDFGSGGSPSVSGIGVNKVGLTTDWQKFIITFNNPSVSGKTIGANNFLLLIFWFDTGSSFDARTDSLGQQSGTFDIAQVKLEKGSIATPFVPKTYDKELEACLRFCYVPDTETQYTSVALGVGRSSTETKKFIYFPKRMRKVPLLTVTPSEWSVWDYMNTLITCSALSIELGAREMCTLKATVASGVTQYRPYVLINNTVNKKMIFDAEL